MRVGGQTFSFVVKPLNADPGAPGLWSALSSQLSMIWSQSSSGSMFIHPPADTWRVLRVLAGDELLFFYFSSYFWSAREELRYLFSSHKSIWMAAYLYSASSIILSSSLTIGSSVSLQSQRLILSYEFRCISRQSILLIKPLVIKCSVSPLGPLPSWRPFSTWVEMIERSKSRWNMSGPEDP